MKVKIFKEEGRGVIHLTSFRCSANFYDQLFYGFCEVYAKRYDTDFLRYYLWGRITVNGVRQWRRICICSNTIQLISSWAFWHAEATMLLPHELREFN